MAAALLSVTLLEREWVIATALPEKTGKCEGRQKNAESDGEWHKAVIRPRSVAISLRRQQAFAASTVQLAVRGEATSLSDTFAQRKGKPDIYRLLSDTFPTDTCQQQPG